MNDASILSRINELMSEEHAILDREGAGERRAEDHEQLRELQTTLDQCWDLLRQRRALRETGNDPDLAQPRSEGVVEHYVQ